jgi:hypothetical protein
MRTFYAIVFLLCSNIVFSQTTMKLTSNCTLMTEPSMGSKEISKIESGSIVKIISGPTNYYYYVDYYGNTGYLFKDCLTSFQNKSSGAISYNEEDINSYKTEYQFKEYFARHITELDPIEGIWSVVQASFTFFYNNEPFGTKETTNLIGNKIAIVKNNEKFIVFKKDGDDYTLSDETYESKSVPGQYFCHQYYYKIPHTMNATMNDLYSLEFIVKMDYRAIQQNEVFIDMAKNIGEPNTNKFDAKTSWKYSKISPTYIDYTTPKIAKPELIKSSGTGFAISSNGYIATCNHVIEGATTIKVKGINGDFSKEYNATVITSDKNNDLALIKISDPAFISLSSIPYAIKASVSDVGASIFTLGYPLTATMGDEVKFTDGSISAKSGFKGDITSYQISAAAQPGNSGGPLFDKLGNIIGIVSAKHVLAENATYAVKSSYLLNLIESSTASIKLQTVNSLTTKSLTDQIKLINNFVYIIEIN